MTTKLTFGRRRIAAAGLAVVGVVSAAALASGTAGASTSYETAPVVSTALQASVAATYGALRTRSTAEDAFSVGGMTVADLAQLEPGFVPSSARALKGASGNLLVIGETTSGKACLALLGSDGANGMDCTDPAIVSPVLSTYGHAIGLAPDGVTSVTVSLVSGGTTKIPVVGGLYTTPPEATSASYVVAGKAQTVDLLPAVSRPTNVSSSAPALINSLSPNN